MKKEKLYTTKRYLLIIALSLFLIFLGAFMERAWYATPENHFNIGISILEGKEPYQAVPHFLLANKSKNPIVKSLSAYQLGKLYSKGDSGVSPDMKKAVFYYEQAAEMNLPEAQYELALLYDVGDKIPENRDRAIKLMTDAARILPEAKYALAVWIERGYLGKPNQAWAVSLYEQAAYAGIKNAIKSLISIYHGGYGRFPENIKEELYWRSRLKKENKKK